MGLAKLIRALGGRLILFFDAANGSVELKVGIISLQGHFEGAIDCLFGFRGLQHAEADYSAYADFLTNLVPQLRAKIFKAHPKQLERVVDSVYRTVTGDRKSG